ncbi:MAG: bifunctional diaminohydroxyphosphoribosylaminopyrimidine deaminase/5-amino-6-(5-phosphoribosylamino)uracil reductase RibD [Gemmatimonadaceae bacterium]|nr:bifunctional diaminohydroxyphosphoribosylaminopyrimidine deaminase/5-amino-6-(5-phosphoribosylamino)uracil reductase RibD [Gemmatimonadaceae bacterium]
MRSALTLARRGWGRTAPNPMVGAVVVRDGQIVGRGYHAAFGEPHAEVTALREAGALAQGATLVVTLEPCNHHGKTPPCVDAILAAGIAEVLYAVEDPTPVAGGGAARLQASGVRVSVGVERAAAAELNAPFFFAAQDSSRPFITLKLAISLDGALTDATRSSGWLTGELARREVHRLRTNADAIAVGSGTALADDPQLTVRSGRRPRIAPLRVVFDRRAQLPLTSQLVRTARKLPTLLATAEPPPAAAAALEAKGVQLLPATSLSAHLAQLRARGVRHLFAEGGAGLAGALLGLGAVDRLVIFQAPVVLGQGALGAFSAAPPATVDAVRRWRVVEDRWLNDDRLLVLAP